MTFDGDTFFRRLWLTNGILLALIFLLVLGGSGYLLVEASFDRQGGGVRAPVGTVPPEAGAVRPRAVRYGPPAGAVGSPVQIIEVRYGAGFAEPSPGVLLGGMSSYARGIDHGPIVNVIFLPPTGPGRILLDRPAYIQALTFPRTSPEWREQRVDTVPWITYSIAFEDTDGDGTLGWEDARELYISDLDGTRFRRVLPAGLALEDVQRYGTDRLLVLALEGGTASREEKEQALERAFLYTPRTGTLEPYAEIDSLAARAGRIVGQRVAPGGPR